MMRLGMVAASTALLLQTGCARSVSEISSDVCPLIQNVPRSDSLQRVKIFMEEANATAATADAMNRDYEIISSPSVVGGPDRHCSYVILAHLGDPNSREVAAAKKLVTEMQKLAQTRNETDKLKEQFGRNLDLLGRDVEATRREARRIVEQGPAGQ